MISGIPSIEMNTEDITFKYKVDAGSGTGAGNTMLGTLAQKISQKRLSRGDREAIARWEMEKKHWSKIELKLAGHVTFGYCLDWMRGRVSKPENCVYHRKVRPLYIAVSSVLLYCV